MISCSRALYPSMAKPILGTRSDILAIPTTNVAGCQSHSGTHCLLSMGTDPNPPQIQLEKTYNAAADHYDHPAVSFWDRFGRRTVERMSLAPGMKVLDVCCGMGGSAV